MKFEEQLLHAHIEKNDTYHFEQVCSLNSIKDKGENIC